QWKHVADVVLQDAAPVTLREHPVHVLPEAEGAGLLPIGEGAALVEGGVHSDPARGHGAKEDAEHGAGAGGDAAGALEDLHRLEGRVQALERAGAGVPVEERSGRDRHRAAGDVALLVHRRSPLHPHPGHFLPPPHAGYERGLTHRKSGSMEVTSPETIAAAVAVLRRGGLVGLPTETVYGLAADAENELAVRRIFAVKGRPSTHPLIVHVAQ